MALRLAARSVDLIRAIAAKHINSRKHEPVLLIFMRLGHRINVLKYRLDIFARVDMKEICTAFSTTLKSAVIGAVALAFSIQSAFACPCSEVTVPESPPTDFTIDAGIKYMQTPEYKKEFETAVADARKACEKHLGEKNVAIVSDIDETVLSNADYFAKNKDAGWSKWNEWIDSAKDTTLKPSADFLAWARKNGFAVFFITGRTESERGPTIANLVKAGFAYDGLYMRPDGDSSRAEDMKSKYREQIEKLGFKIIVSIGDQYSDLAGGHAEDCEKLPNKMYFIK